MLRFDSKFSNDNTNGEFDLEAGYGYSLVFSLSDNLNFDEYYNKRDAKIMYLPMYINIKSLGYRCLIEMSFNYGNFFYKNAFVSEVCKIGEQLTLKNTQYVPQVKREENLTEN